MKYRKLLLLILIPTLFLTIISSTKDVYALELDSINDDTYSFIKLSEVSMGGEYVLNPNNLNFSFNIKNLDFNRGYGTLVLLPMDLLNLIGFVSSNGSNPVIDTISIFIFEYYSGDDPYYQPNVYYNKSISYDNFYQADLEPVYTDFITLSLNGDNLSTDSISFSIILQGSDITTVMGSYIPDEFFNNAFVFFNKNKINEFYDSGFVLNWLFTNQEKVAESIGRESGFYSGREEGLTEGFNIGRDAGRDEGYENAKNEFGYNNDGIIISGEDAYTKGKFDGIQESGNLKTDIINFIPGVLGAIFMFFFQLGQIGILGITILDIIGILVLITGLIFLIKFFF